MPDLEVVKKVAALSRIELSPNELEQVNQKLKTVLDFFEDLQKISVDGIPPFSHGVDEMNLRSDDSEPGLSQEWVLKNAPESLDSCFKLPRIVGGVE